MCVFAPTCRWHCLCHKLLYVAGGVLLLFPTVSLSNCFTLLLFLSLINCLALLLLSRWLCHCFAVCFLFASHLTTCPVHVNAVIWLFNCHCPLTLPVLVCTKRNGLLSTDASHLFCSRWRPCLWKRGDTDRKCPWLPDSANDSPINCNI